MMTARLMIPEQRYVASYHDFCRELRATGIRYFTSHDPNAYDEWKDTIIERYEKDRTGIDLPGGYVPSTALWLIDNDEVVGACSIRHHLTDSLRQYGGHIGYGIKPSKWRMGYGAHQLSLALIEAKKIGIDRALVTCDDTNVGSARVIEKNGGILEDVAETVGDGISRLLRRYWIDIS